MTIEPYVLTFFETSNLEAYSGGSLGLYLSLGVAFIPALISSFLVMEVETNIRHQ
jgi:hypothetical protein